MRPFATYDVFAVHFLVALPVAIFMTMIASRHWSLTTCRVLGGLLLLVAAGIAWALASGHFARQPSSSAVSFAARAMLTLTLATGAALCAAHFLNRHLPSNFTSLFGGWTAVLAAIVLPAASYTYESARCHHDRARLADYLEQSRLGAAQSVAEHWLILQPDATFRGQPLAKVAQDLQQAIDAIAQRTEQPLPSNATTPIKLARAQDLAILGRNAAAIDVLSTVPELTSSPAACNLAGTIGETEQAWVEAADWYGRARDLCRSARKSTEPSPELIRATMGLAYCARKQGDLAAAEKSYLELLSLSPTADTYFLLATFYEDTQQVTKAKTCARKAMALAPDRYQAEGEKLIDKLITLHFGCLNAYQADE